MELLSGTQLAWQQYVALLRKNMILTWRHKRSTFLQLFASLFLLCLSFWMNKVVVARLSISGEIILQPQAVLSPPIPPCEDKFFAKTPCYDFLWSGNSSPRIEAIAHAIMKNNPGRPIPANKVKSFATAEDVNSWLLENPLRCPGVLHFSVKDANIISYGIQTNSTPVARRSTYEDVNFKFKIPLQISAEREIARSLIGDPNLEWDVGLKQFAYPAKDTYHVSDDVDEVGPAVFLAIAMFGFVFQISSLVTEKELKLRQAMSMMGLYESAYWLSWLTWEALLTLISSLLTVLFGIMFQFRFFKNNSFAVLFCLFFLFQLNMTSFAFMVSTFVNKSSSATTVGFSIFIIGFLTQIGDKFDFPYSESFKEEYRIMWSFFPPNLFTKAINMLSKATATTKDAGISWSGRADCSIKEPGCIITIDIIYQWLLATFFMWFILAIYFDNILPNVNGGRKFVLYFLNPHYWTGNGGSKTQEGSIFSCMGSVPAIEEDSQKDEDVLAEETIVKRQTENGEANPDVALEVRGLAKTYPGGIHLSRGFCCCCKCKRTPPYHAVKGIWVNFAKDQLFCLLGPNGAGKTTVINCLTGITPITNGDALIYGNSVRSSVGMANIRRMIGVCPQFDILWDALTATEHLVLFASIKGLPPSEINGVAYKSLAEVKLANAANVRAGSYSGGMKRRLSVAIALIGDPKMVFLDEPTTGMDPITRRHVWDIIEHAKKGRAIVLTTHSMEEADILSDRIAIMAKGKLRCIGTSIRLKSRFGAGYIANINFSTVGDGNSHLESVKRFFLDRLNVKPKEENKAFLTFVIPHEKEPLLTNFFAELQDRENEFGISDIQLGLTTLEEVFLNIAKKAELESSIDEGNLVTLHLTSGTSLQVQKGVRYVGIPGTECYKNPRGLMVEVCWEQGEDGTLCISGHSDEMSVPADVELIRNPSLQRKDSIPVGYVIEPSQLNS